MSDKKAATLKWIAIAGNVTYAPGSSVDTARRAAVLLGNALAKVE